MLPDNLPHCVCGAWSWSSHGGNFGPGLAQSNFKCLSCHRFAIALEGFGVGAHVFFPREGAQLGDEANRYINGPLFATWRTYEAAGKKREEQLYEERQLTHKHVLGRLGLPEGTSYYDLPQDVRTDIDAQRDQLRKDAWSAPAPLPPQLPLSLRVFIRSGNDWVEVDHAESALLPVPRDPIAVRHEEYWGSVFAVLEDLACRPIQRKEIPNDYYRDENKLEPWYEFNLNGLVFTLGPRKRVDAIYVNGSGKPFPTARIAAQAKADGVTYTADGGWHNFGDEATSIEVHAWSKEKLLQYLKIIIEETLS